MMESVNHEFFERLDRLTKGERTALKRNAGVMLDEADGKAIRAFYSCLPAAVRRGEARYFAAACFHCLWDADAERIALEQAFFQLGKDEELSGSLEHRLVTMLDFPWEEDGFLLTKLSRMMKLVRSKGIAIDCNSLLEDLLYWNAENRSVQKKWARALYINEM